MKKRIVSFILSVLMLCSLTACGSTTPTTSGATQSNDAAATPITVPAATTPAPVTLEDAGTLGDYDVQIHDFKLANDYAGKPAILIGFSFTNNSEENESVMFALSYKAYQNGVQLDSAIIMDNSVYNADDLMKDVQPGASIDVVAAYSLSSETAPVEFEVEEIISFSDEMLGKTFEIAEGGVTELSVAPGSDTAMPYLSSLIKLEKTTRERKPSFSTWDSQIMVIKPQVLLSLSTSPHFRMALSWKPQFCTTTICLAVPFVT